MTELADSGFVVVSGMSGAGKTGFANALEDAGWFVVDNLPPSLLPDLHRTLTAPDAGSPRRIAVVADVRGGALFNEFSQAMHTLHTSGVTPVVVFLDASSVALVRRFESSRRPHPLQGSGNIAAAIEEERGLLVDVRRRADLVIDTSDLNVHGIRRRANELFAPGGMDRLRMVVMSFGFKYGVPIDADIVCDMRFAPNPYWIPELRALSGLDAQVAKYVLAHGPVEDYLDGLFAMVRAARPGYLVENKRFVTIGVGCTGGRHRSVASAERLGARLRADGNDVTIVHRDLGRE